MSDGNRAPPEKEAPSCRQGDWLPESTVSRTEQATPRSSAPREPSGGQNKGLGSPMLQGSIARSGTFCPMPRGLHRRLWAGVAQEAANREGCLRPRGGRPGARRPGECALVICQTPQPALDPLAPCPQALAAVSRCESFRTRTLAQQPQQVTRIFRFHLEGPDWTGNKATQTCPLPPSSCLRWGVKAAGEPTCVHEPLPPQDASLQPSRLLEVCFQHHGGRGRRVSFPALFTQIRSLGVQGVQRGWVMVGSFGSSSSLSLPSPSECVQHRGQSAGRGLLASRVKARWMLWV